MATLRFCAVVAVIAVVAQSCATRAHAARNPGFELAAFTCNVSMPPSAPVLGVGSDNDHLYYMAWGTRVFDAQSLALLRNGSDAGVYMAVASPDTGYTVLSLGSVLKPEGMGLYKVNLNTLTPAMVGKINMSNDWSIESLSYPPPKAGAASAPAASADVYVTVSAGFMRAASLFGRIDTSTGELKDTVQLVFDINGAGNSGIGMPAFDQYRGDAYFWVTGNTVSVVDLDTMAVRNLTMPSAQSTTSYLNGQAAAVLALPDSRYLGYMHGISEFKYEFVIVNLDDPSNVISVPVELPALPAKAQLFGVGPTVATMTDLSDSFFYFYLSTWRTTFFYKVSGQGRITMAPAISGSMADIEVPLVAGPPGSVYALLTQSGLPPPNGTHYPKYCTDNGFFLARVGPVDAHH